MTGYGTYGYGGPYLPSSASSSLSALAPPFTVDRPVPKLISSPLMDITEPPPPPPPPAPHVTPLNSSLHNWLPPHSPSTGSNFFANPTPLFDSVPSSNAYRYAGMPMIDSSSTNVPPLNTVTPSPSNGFAYDQGLDVAAATSFVEAKPYYPSYLSPTIHGDAPLVVPDQPSYDWLSTSQFAPLDGSSPKDYTQRPSGSKYTAQWGGSWNGPAEWEQGKQGQFDERSCSKEIDGSSSLYKNHLNQEPHSSNSFKSYSVNEVASHGLNIPGWDGTVNGEQLGDNSCAGKISKFNPVGFSKPIMGTFSVVPETSSKASYSPFVTKPMYSVSSEKRQRDTSQNDIASVSKSSPAFFIRPPAIGTKSSEPEKSLLKRLNSKRDAANADQGGYYPSSVQESHLPQSSEDKKLFDSSHLGIHLGRNDPFSVELSSTKDKELSNNGSINSDALDCLFKVQPGLPNSHVKPDGFDMALNINDSINSFLNSSENVDSPCWKGVPGSRFSPFGVSEERSPEQMTKLEGCSGLNSQMPMMFPPNAGETLSSKKPIKDTAEYRDFGWLGSGLLGNNLPLNPNNFLAENSACGEHKLDDTMKPAYYPGASHDRGVQSCSDIPKSGYPADKSSSLFEDSHIMHQGFGKGGLTAEAKHTTWSIGAADEKLDIKDSLEHGSSHVPSPAVKNMLCSPCVEDAATEPTKSSGEESFLKMDVQMLVNTMNSLSELLLIDCTNGLCQLKKKDLDTLKAVTNNLNICISKNGEKWLPVQESPSFQQSTLQYTEELRVPHKNAARDGPQLTKIYAPGFKDPLDLDLQGVQKVMKHYTSVKNDGEVMGSTSAKRDQDLVKEDNMTQALKKILSENFQTEETDPQTLMYKSLWLEAEAALCSTNYKARFNRMKTEMDKCKGGKSKDYSDVFEHTADMMKQPRSEGFPDSNPADNLTPKVHDCPKSNLQDVPVLNQEDDVMARFHILRSRIENSNSMNVSNGYESSSKVSSVPEVDKVTPGSSSPRISNQDSPTSSIIGLTNDYEASVMARFHILRDRNENSKFISTANLEDTASSKVSHDLKVDEVALETSDDGSIPDLNLQDSLVTSTTNYANDCEASVLARFNILKSRADNCNDMLSDGQVLEKVDDGYTGTRNLQPIFCKRSVNGSSAVKEQQPVLQSHIADNNEGKFVTANEFRLFVENNPGTQSHGINRLTAGWPENSSSDWEHVMKEEVWGQNC